MLLKNDILNIKKLLNIMSKKCGIYVIFNNFNEVIYVGKAKNLKKRLTSYFNYNTFNSNKTKAIIRNMKNIDVIVTNSENEALLLEKNYIKLHQPRYNMLSRDDKSYKFIFISNDTYPYIKCHNGLKKEEGYYFGPFVNGKVIKNILITIQKIFPIRQCDNSDYYNRRNPCLKYRIGYCLGPCITNLVDKEKYNQQVKYVRYFLSGKSDKVINILTNHMKQASKKMKFEEAARIRDQIKLISNSIEKNCFTMIDKQENVDAISIAFKYNIACIYIFFIRYGKILGNDKYFIESISKKDLLKSIQTFISQFYLEKKSYSMPEKILLDSTIMIPVEELEKLISNQISKNVIIKFRNYKKYDKIIKLAHINAKFSLVERLPKKSILNERLMSLTSDLNVKSINKINCFDVSHTMGEHTVASCIILDNKKLLKFKYRLYTINNTVPGNDCYAINQVIFYHFNKLKKEDIPNLVIIDGGKNQLNAADNAFKKLNDISNKRYSNIILLSIAKKNNNKSNLENLFIKNKNKEISKILLRSSSLNLIRYIRDQAHNYAIYNHRNKLTRSKISSYLESINGINLKRSKLILKYIGGLNQLFNASIEDLVRIPGISYVLAKRIFDKLRNINLCS